MRKANNTLAMIVEENKKKMVEAMDKYNLIQTY